MKIYTVKISDINKKILEGLCLLIDSETRWKIQKFINKRDKIRTLIGEILIRTIIIEQLDIKNKYITFSRNQYGKPYLKGSAEFNFNISHSEDFVVCIISDKPVGIDIEKIKYIEYEKIAKKFFSIDELNYIVKKDSDIELNKFYKIWTLKESYIKCCGQGLYMPLDLFSIDIDEYNNVKVIINKEHKKFIFKIFNNIELGYKMAVCSLNQKIPNSIMRITQNRLINRYLRFNH
jgi:4'-phosphopantetheinyl transferase